MTRTVLCYGDSNTHGTPPVPHLDFEGRHAPADRWPNVMAAALPDWTVIAEGHPGRTTVHDDPLEGGTRTASPSCPRSLNPTVPSIW